MEEKANCETNEAKNKAKTVDWNFVTPFAKFNPIKPTPNKAGQRMHEDI